MKTIQVRRTRHAGHCWRSRDELIRDVLQWTSTYGRAKADDQLEHTYSSYVRIRDVALKTCQRRWTIGRSGERGSGISVLVARHDDIYIYIYIYMYIYMCVCVCVCVCFFWLDICATWLFSSSTSVFRPFFLLNFFPRYQFVEVPNCTIWVFSHKQNYRLDIRFIYIYIYTLGKGMDPIILS